MLAGKLSSALPLGVYSLSTGLPRGVSLQSLKESKKVESNEGKLIAGARTKSIQCPLPRSRARVAGVPQQDPGYHSRIG